MGFLSRTSDEVVSEKIIEYFHRRFQEEVKLESFNLKDIKIDPQRGFENLLDLRKMNVGLKELSSASHIPRTGSFSSGRSSSSTAPARSSIPS